MLGMHMGVCINEGLCDHHMNYVESLEVNCVSMSTVIFSVVIISSTSEERS